MRILIGSLYKEAPFPKENFRYLLGSGTLGFRVL